MSSVMLQNIFEQPNVAERCLNLDLQQPSRLNAIEQVQILACGSSYHAGLVAKFWFEDLALMPTEVWDAANVDDRPVLKAQNHLLLLLSQSGSTADVLNAFDQKFNLLDPTHLTMGITNRTQTPLHKICSHTIQTPAGEEGAIAATKSFLSQLLILLRLSLEFKTTGNQEIEVLKDGLKANTNKIPEIVKNTIENQTLEKPAIHIAKQNRLIILGQGINYPIALEGALKIKETTYIPAEGMSIGSFMHGPIAIIEPDYPVVVMASSSDPNHDKIMTQILRLKTYGAYVIGISNEANPLFDHHLQVAPSHHLLSPIVNVLPLQLLAHEIARQKELDIDRPRHLTKSIDH
jgi:glucosamine 6-phosphate synthetase-like amidotransferase/phosphosugar isomerase protein